jgi:hypothetical protein
MHMQSTNLAMAAVLWLTASGSQQEGVTSAGTEEVRTVRVTVPASRPASTAEEAVRRFLSAVAEEVAAARGGGSMDQRRQRMAAARDRLYALASRTGIVKALSERFGQNVEGREYLLEGYADQTIRSWSRILGHYVDRWRPARMRVMMDKSAELTIAHVPVVDAEGRHDVWIEMKLDRGERESWGVLEVRFRPSLPARPATTAASEKSPVPSGGTGATTESD